MNNEHAVNRSLVLAGGGMRLAYHAGVLCALHEAGIGFNHVDGTSGGIFGTAMLASGISPTEAAQRWRNLDLRGFIALLPLGNYRSQHRLPAIGSADGVRKKIFPALGIDVQKINKNTAFAATFNVCNFSTKTVEAIPHTTVTEDHLVAGISLPMFMPAVNIGDVWYTDAVWLKDANLTEAVSRNAAEIWLVWCIGNTPNYLHGFFNQYVHMIEMSANGGLITELGWIRQQNEIRARNGQQPIMLHLIKPEYPLPLDPEFFLNRIDADTLVNMGYADTRQYLQSARPMQLVNNAGEIAMKTAGNTLHFRQCFTGRLVCGSGQVLTCFRLAFFAHETDGAITWRQFASVAFGQGTVISTWQNKITVGKGRIQSNFMFTFSGRNYEATVVLRLQHVTDLLIGLDIRSAHISISTEGLNAASAVFVQSIKTRITNAFYLYVKAEKNWWGRRAVKRRILNTVIK